VNTCLRCTIHWGLTDPYPLFQLQLIPWDRLSEAGQQYPAALNPAMYAAVAGNCSNTRMSPVYLYPQHDVSLCYKQEDRVIESRWCNIFFNLPNPSSRTMTLGSTQPLNRNEYQGPSCRVKGGRRVWLTLPPSVSRLSTQNVGASTSYNPMGLHGLLQG
jgi:hypothetical protein